MTDLQELLTLIRLLKAEGVQEYTASGIHLSLYPAEPASPRAGDGLAAGEVSQVATGEAATSSAPLTQEVAPKVLAGLNPNYAKLVGWSTR